MQLEQTNVSSIHEQQLRQRRHWRCIWGEWIRLHGIEHGHGWVEATPHRSGWRKRRTEKKKDRSWRESQTTGEDSYKPWSDFGGQRPPPSCHFSYMQWDGERPSLKEDKSPVQYRKIQERKEKKTEKKRRAQGLDRFGTWRKKRRIIVLIFNEKNVFIWSLSHSEERNSPGNCPNPFSGNHQLQRKVLEPNEHTPRHTNPHTPEHVDTKAAETQTPKIKTVRLAHPQQQRMKQFYIADRKQKKYWQDCQRLCQLKVQTMIQNIQVHMMSYWCANKITLMNFSRQANASPLKKK